MRKAPLALGLVAGIAELAAVILLRAARPRPAGRDRLEPSRGTADLGGPDRGQHRPLRVPLAGLARVPDGDLEPDPGRGPGRGPERLPLLPARAAQAQPARTR